MNMKKCSNPMNINGIEEWMTQFFTDPFTNLLDEHTFRVDLFETSEEFIIEAELGEMIKKDDIEIDILKEKVTISIKQNISEESKGEERTRTVSLPYIIEDKLILASLMNGILEVKISKLCRPNRKQTSISIEG